MHGFTIKIKMLVLAKALPTAFLKQTGFTERLFIFSNKKKRSTLGKRELEIEDV